MRSQNLKIPAVLKNKTLLFVFINLLFVSFFFFYNCNTGLYADDFGYMYMFSAGDKLTCNRIDSIGEVFISQYNHYFIMNGRSVSHTILQFSLMLGKGAFNVINTLFYFALSTGMYMLAKRGRGLNPWIMLAVYLIPWLFYPAFGQIYLMACLSVNYMCTMAIIVWFLVPFKLLYSGSNPFARRSKAAAALMPAAGIIAGWCSENGSAMMLFMLGCMGLYYLIAKKKIPGWCYTGFAGGVLGFFMMLTAPGYDVRLEQSASPGFAANISSIIAHTVSYSVYIFAVLICLAYLIYSKSAARRLRIAAACVCVVSAAAAAAVSACFGGYACNRAIVYAAVSAVMLTCFIRSQSIRASAGFAALCAGGTAASFFIGAVHTAVPKLVLLCLMLAAPVWLCAAGAWRQMRGLGLRIPYILMAGSVVANLVMIATPQFQTRSEMPFFIIFTCGACTVLVQWLDDVCDCLRTKWLRPALMTAAVSFAVLCLTVSAVHTSENYSNYTDRLSYIEEQKQQGNLSVTVYPLPDTGDRHVVFFEMSNSDPDYWVNRAKCWYYGLESVSYSYNSANSLT